MLEFPQKDLILGRSIGLHLSDFAGAAVMEEVAETEKTFNHTTQVRMCYSQGIQNAFTFTLKV